MIDRRGDWTKGDKANWMKRDENLKDIKWEWEIGE